MLSAMAAIWAACHRLSPPHHHRRGGRRAAAFEGPGTVFFIFGVRGALWHREYSAVGVPIFDDGTQRFFGVAMGKWKLLATDAAQEMAAAAEGPDAIIIQASLHKPSRLRQRVGYTL